MTRRSVAFLVGVLAIVLAGSVEAEEATIEARWQADRRALIVTVDGGPCVTLEGIGPVADEPGASVVREDVQPQRSEVLYRTSGGAPWTAVLRPTAAGEFTVELTSPQCCFDTVSPGTVADAGAWIGLDLSQYALAHGQAFWPKTYYLPQQKLFLCAWWNLEVTAASRPEWPEAACAARRGEGPFAPAALMQYVAGPDGRHASLRETLHVRVARRLWDAALPSLCQPSEYAGELSQAVYLDDWSGQSAAEVKHLLGVLKRLAWPRVHFLTILQNWQAAGFDALLPDSVRMPDYPPCPAIGTVEELRQVSEAGRALGRFGFRTNYLYLRTQSPSYRHGEVDFAQGSDGKPLWYTQPSRWLELARRQEAEIARLWQPNAGLTDQLGSGGHASAYLDFNRIPGADGTAATALAHQRELARFIKETHGGPLGTETLIQQDLMGYYCDFADFGVMGGHDRLFTPEYKLRRLQQTTVNYGCGLYYRFFELPPFPKFHANQLDLWKEAARMDDYRCCEVLLGNGGYIFWPCPWSYALTEALLVGRLQRHYALTPVTSVEYEAEGTWQSLEDLVRAGFCPETTPWTQKQSTLGRIRIRYGNGLTVVGNRLPEAMSVSTPAGPLVLPQYGWVAYQPDGSLRAFSAHRPGSDQRIDCLEEGPDGLRFLNPRGAAIEGSREIRLWQGKTLLWSVDPRTDTARLDGEELPLNFPRPAPLADLAFDFSEGLGGWRPTQGILRLETTGAGTQLATVGGDVLLQSPAMDLAGRADDVLELTLATDAGDIGFLYFATAEEGISLRQRLEFHPTPDGKPHTIEIAVGQHPGWANHRIRSLRLDPIHGPAEATVILQGLKLRRS